jgi:hypothetical protein
MQPSRGQKLLYFATANIAIIATMFYLHHTGQLPERLMPLVAGVSVLFINGILLYKLGARSSRESAARTSPE